MKLGSLFSLSREYRIHTLVKSISLKLCLQCLESHLFSVPEKWQLSFVIQRKQGMKRRFLQLFTFMAFGNTLKHLLWMSPKCLLIYFISKILFCLCIRLPEVPFGWAILHTPIHYTIAAIYKYCLKSLKTTKNTSMEHLTILH